MVEMQWINRCFVRCSLTLNRSADLFLVSEILKITLKNKTKITIVAGKSHI